MARIKTQQKQHECAPAILILQKLNKRNNNRAPTQHRDLSVYNFFNFLPSIRKLPLKQSLI